MKKKMEVCSLAQNPPNHLQRWRISGTVGLPICPICTWELPSSNLPFHWWWFSPSQWLSYFHLLCFHSNTLAVCPMQWEQWIQFRSCGNQPGGCAALHHWRPVSSDRAQQSPYWHLVTGWCRTWPTLASSCLAGWDCELFATPHFPLSKRLLYFWICLCVIRATVLLQQRDLLCLGICPHSCK